jgi:hypothetical protein
MGHGRKRPSFETPRFAPLLRMTLACVDAQENGPFRGHFRIVVNQ